MNVFGMTKGQLARPQRSIALSGVCYAGRSGRSLQADHAARLVTSGKNNATKICDTRIPDFPGAVDLLQVLGFPRHQPHVSGSRRR